MADFHTHVLPGIDDGSRNLEMTSGLLQQEREQGVAAVIATPHFYATETSFEKFFIKRNKALEQVRGAHLAQIVRVSPRALDEQTALRNHAPMRIIPAAEVYYFPGISRAEHIKELCIAGTNLLLLEMPFGQWTGEVIREVDALMGQRGIQVILAHIERFYAYQKDKGCMEELLSGPVYLQINAGSFQNFTERRALKKALDLKKPTVLGSDCHSLNRRPVNLEEGRAWLEKQIGPGTVRRLDRTGRDILLHHMI